MTNMDDLVISIKEHEGFSPIPYIDPLVRKELAKSDPDVLETIEKHLPDLKLTIGYGTLLRMNKKEATVLLRLRLATMVEKLFSVQSIFRYLPSKAQNIFAEMAYQLGVAGVMKFKKTWALAEEHEFEAVSVEMLNSKWHKQTPERSEELASRMKQIKTQG